MNKITIMLADDHQIVRESIKMFLEEDNFVVIGEASDGSTAVAMANHLRPRVLIMDIEMPNLNGIEATRKIKELCPEIAILILTAYDYDQYVFALLESGADGYLLKDVSGRELIAATKRIYRGESVWHPTVAGKVINRLRDNNHKEHELIGPLTKREKEVLRLTADGLKNKEIGKRLYVSVRTIEAHLGNIFAKLGVGSRTEAIMTALKAGMINLDQIQKQKDGKAE